MLSRNVAVVAGVFSITIALLLLLNFIQMSRSKPLDSNALTALVQQLNKDPNNDQLKAEIRDFDLLARKAYFNTQWQVRTGGRMLLIGAMILVLAMRVYYSLKSKITLSEAQSENDFTSRLLAQRWVMILGGAIFALGIGSSYISADHLAKYEVDESKTETASAGQSNGIEVIEVGQNPEASEPASTSQPAKQQTDAAQAPNQTTEIKQGIPVQGGKAEGATAVTEGKAVVAGAAAETALKFPGSDAIKTNSPGFRGPFGVGVSFHKNIPLDFDVASGKNILWKVPVPKMGFNSPVIWGNKLFLSGANSSVHELYCFDRNSGKILWTQPADKILPKKSANTNGKRKKINVVTETA